MRRVWQTWFYFCVCLALVFGSMARVTLIVLELDDEQRAVGHRAAEEEVIRLALWRMDSQLAPLIGREHARDFRDYSSFYTMRSAYTRMFNKIQEGDVLVPSPLLTNAPPGILLHFQIGHDGQLTSPQVPSSNMRDLAELRYTTAERIGIYAARLDRLRAFNTHGALTKGLRPTDAKTRRVTSVSAGSAWIQRNVSTKQIARNTIEYQQRKTSAQQLIPQFADNEPEDRIKTQGEPQAGGVTAQNEKQAGQAGQSVVMFEEALFLRRQSYMGNQVFIQGCWLDWPQIRLRLLSSIRDLLPNASLRLEHAGGNTGRMLAAIDSVRLIPGKISHLQDAALSPIRMSVLFAWICVLVAAVAVAALLHGAIGLSERRGNFVSAVTHELRTPLTTFRMYTEMLADNMITDPEKRNHYLQALHAQANRLGYLVENVLAFARLEGGRRTLALEGVPVREIIRRAHDRLRGRAEQANMELVTDNCSDELAARADPAAIEHILFNLVDNACKYAATASDRRIELHARGDGNFVYLTVRDYGPGIAPEEKTHIFKPFSKSARQAAQSAPGVGLGLSLSRRLARSMRGDLALDSDTRPGAAFILKLRATRTGGTPPREQ